MLARPRLAASPNLEPSVALPEALPNRSPFIKQLFSNIGGDA
jgi:hypothetical protein